MGVGMRGLKRNSVYTTTVYLLYGRWVDVEMRVESVERITSIFLKMSCV